MSSVFGIIEHASEYKSRIREIYPSALWSANLSAVETPPAITQISAFLRLSFFNASLVWTAIIAYHMVRFHLGVNGFLTCQKKSVLESRPEKTCHAVFLVYFISYASLLAIVS